MNRFLSSLSTVLLSTLLFPVLQSCGGSSEATADMSTEERYKIGLAALEDENYLKAQQQFEIILLQDPASEWADDAQFYLGEAHYRDSDYKLAAFHFNRVVRDFPSSIHYKRALFQTGDCYFQVSPNYERDQQETENAIKQFQLFTKIFANDSLTSVAQERIVSLRTKLARRAFTVATHYLNNDEFQAAEIYFQRVIDLYPETEYYEQALAGLEETTKRLQKQTEERALSRK